MGQFFLAPMIFFFKEGNGYIIQRGGKVLVKKTGKEKVNFGKVLINKNEVFSLVFLLCGGDNKIYYFPL